MQDQLKSQSKVITTLLTMTQSLTEHKQLYQLKTVIYYLTQTTLCGKELSSILCSYIILESNKAIAHACSNNVQREVLEGQEHKNKEAYPENVFILTTNLPDQGSITKKYSKTRLVTHKPETFIHKKEVSALSNDLAK